MTKRYKPKKDKLYAWLSVTVNAVCLPMLVIGSFDPISLFAVIPIILFCNYFLISPLFGYVELREDHLFIKYGLLLKKRLPYSKIRSAEIKRSVISEAMMNLKLSLDHVVIKYNSFDFTIVSVKENEAFISELTERKNNN